MIKLGVDNGNYNTKSSEGMIYASGYATSDKEFIMPEMQLFLSTAMAHRRKPSGDISCVTISRSGSRG